MQTKLNEFPAAMVIYEIHAALPGADRFQAYVGRCRLDELHMLTDARRNEAMRNLLQNADFMRVAQITILAIETDPKTIFEKHINGFTMLLNPAHAYISETDVMRPKRGRQTEKIECNETGEIWENAAAACKALAVDPAAMSRHLKTGRGRVAGCTFKRWIE